MQYLDGVLVSKCIRAYVITYSCAITLSVSGLVVFVRVLVVHLALLRSAFGVVLVPWEVKRIIGVGWLSKWISSNVMSI